MSYWLSEPVERLISEQDAAQPLNLGTLIVGSGYGAAMAALALTDSQAGNEAAASVCVFERGDEYLPQDFPKTLADIPDKFSVLREATANSQVAQEIGSQSLWDIRVGDGAVSISGSGLGGTSLVNASVLAEVDAKTLQNWPRRNSKQQDGADWHQLLSSCYPKIKELLGASRLANPVEFAKYRSLEKIAVAFGAKAEAADLTVNFDRPTDHSVDHQPCNHCGNCVVGCHSGAKQSLNLNAWPLLKQRGIRMYTGATVDKIEPVNGGWNITVKLTRDPQQCFQVCALKVVLAAGSIGSTEILNRSRSNTMPLSDKLGQKFSANGDGLIFGVGQKDAVNAVADIPHETATNKVGPTIVGIARTDRASSGAAGQLTIEDGAVPYPFTELWQELNASQSFLNRFVTSKRSYWHRKQRHDGLARSADLSRHSQVLLVMGFDNSLGYLKPVGETQNLVPSWPHQQKSGSSSYFESLDQEFERAQKTGAFDGGELFANPLWQFLPKELSRVFAGAENIAQNVTTVHPLGGCVMGEDCHRGVVNTDGQPFTNNPDLPAQVYNNLYVLDGSIIPSAVGVNPMLTIAALSYALASRAAGRSVPDTKSFEALTTNRKMPVVPQSLPASDKSVAGDFTERLIWSIDSTKRESYIAQLQPLFHNRIKDDTRTLVVDLSFYFEDDNTFERWLEHPDKKLRARAQVSQTSKTFLHDSEDTFATVDSILTMEGTVALGVSDRPGFIVESLRTVSALWRFVRYRNALAIHNALGLLKSGAGSGIRNLFRIARLHANWRYLEYQFEESHNDAESCVLQVGGNKKLAYSSSSATIWESLLTLPVQWKRGSCSVAAELEVDLIRITKGPSPFQIRKTPNQIISALNIAGVAGYFARLLAQTHFWSFGAHDYGAMISCAEFDQGRMQPPPEVMHYSTGSGKRQSRSRVDYYSDDKLCRLIRYQPVSSIAHRPVVLLVHGLAHSSEIYWTDNIEENYSQYFLALGYDVWIVDHRTSANTIRNINPQHTWDQIALIDIVWAVHTVFHEINIGHSDPGARQLNVFSHCIGAGAVAMAVLSGKLQQPRNRNVSMIASLVPHAVTPWLYGSVNNRARGNGWGLAKELELIGLVDPRLHKEQGAFEVMVDRVATSSINAAELRQWNWLSELRDTRGAGFARAVYYRYTIFWGLQWNHNNITAKLKNRFAHMIGPVPAPVLTQAYFCVSRKRLVAGDGRNKYVSSENFRKYWTFPTLFLHGGSNQVFDIESSRVSARMLHDLRAELSGDCLASEDQVPDYARHGVWLETLDNYGHMDVIFGMNATREVCPKLDHFFSAAATQNMAWQDERVALGKYTTFAKAYRNRKVKPQDRPATRTRPVRMPYTGPVISTATANRLRLWIESDDYAVRVPTEVVVQDKKTRVNTKLLSGPTAKQDHGDGRFWLLDLLNPATIKHSLRVGLVHGNDQFDVDQFPSGFEPKTGDERLGFASQDIDPDSGYPINLPDLPWFQREYLVRSQQRSSELSIIAGSCLHPGLPFERDFSDQIFSGMLRHITTHRPEVELDGADILLLLGDQIYADATAGVFDPAVDYERFRVRYRQAFAATNMRRVLSQIPTHFVVDDHAFKNNYSGYLESAETRRFEESYQEARNFQSHHQGRLWHSFTRHGKPFFCFDTRFERELTYVDGVRTKRLMKQAQLDEFEEWLNKHADNNILFIATGAPLAPLNSALLQYPSLNQHADGLSAYPDFLAGIARLIIASGTHASVVWMTGDPHLSCYARVKINVNTGSVLIHNVVASPLNAPLPFANAQVRDFDWNKPVAMRFDQQEMELEVTQHLLSEQTRQFTRLDLQQGQLRIRSFGVDGLEIDHHNSKNITLQAVV